AGAPEYVLEIGAAGSFMKLLPSFNIAAEGEVAVDCRDPHLTLQSAGGRYRGRSRCSLGSGGKVFDVLDQRLFGKDCRALDHVFEFTDVPGPVVGLKLTQSGLGELTFA